MSKNIWLCYDCIYGEVTYKKVWRKGFDSRKVIEQFIWCRAWEREKGTPIFIHTPKTQCERYIQKDVKRLDEYATASK